MADSKVAAEADTSAMSRTSIHQQNQRSGEDITKHYIYI